MQVNPPKRARRSRLVPLLLATSLIVAAACGDDTDDTAAAPPVRIVTDYFGTEVAIPTGDLDIVASDPALGNLLALGVKPVASAVNLLSVPSFLADQLDGVEDISAIEPPFMNIERLAAINPDLVLTVGADGAEEICDQLRQVTATFCHPYGFATIDDIRSNLTEVARAIGMDKEAQELVDELDARTTDMAERIVEAGLQDKTVTVLRVSLGGYSVRVGTVESALMRELGMARPTNQQDYEKFAFDLSPETLTQADAYGIYVYVDTDSESAMDLLEANPLWATLEAVKNDRVWLVDGGVWNGVSFPAANAILDDIEATFLADA